MPGQNSRRFSLIRDKSNSDLNFSLSRPCRHSSYHRILEVTLDRTYPCKTPRRTLEETNINPSLQTKGIVIMVLRKRAAIAFASIVVSMCQQGSLLVESRSTVPQDAADGRTRYYRGSGVPGAAGTSSSTTSTSSVQRGSTDHQKVYGTTTTVRGGVRILGMGMDSDDSSKSMGKGGMSSRAESQDDTPSGSPSVSLMPSRAPSEAPSGTPSISLAPSSSAAPTSCSMSKKNKGDSGDSRDSDDNASKSKRRKLKKSGSSSDREDKSCSGSGSADRTRGIGALNIAAPNTAASVHELRNSIVFESENP